MPKMMYEQLIDMIQAGNCTDEMLTKLAGVESTRSLTKFWNQIETRGLFHAKDGDIHVLVTSDEADKMKASSGSPKAKTKKWTEDPNDRRKLFDTRLTTKIGKVSAATTKLEGNENDQILKLRLTIANCEYHIANIQRAAFRIDICKELRLTEDELDANKDLNLQQEIVKDAYEIAKKKAEADVSAEGEGSPATTD